MLGGGAGEPTEVGRDQAGLVVAGVLTDQRRRFLRGQPLPLLPSGHRQLADAGGIGALVEGHVVRMAEHLEHLVEGEVEHFLGAVEAEADADVEPEAPQAGERHTDGGGAVALPQGEDLLRAGQPAAGERAVAERGDEPRLGLGPCGRVTDGDILPVTGGAGGTLELAQQPLRSIDHRRRRHLVAHRPLAPQVLVPLQRGGHGGGGAGQVGQRGRARRAPASRPPSARGRRWPAARPRDRSPCPRGRRRDP